MVELKDKVEQQLRAAEKEAPSRKEQMSQTAKKASLMKEKQKDYMRVSSKHEHALNRAGMRSELRRRRQSSENLRSWLSSRWQRRKKSWRS